MVTAQHESPLRQPVPPPIFLSNKAVVLPVAFLPVAPAKVGAQVREEALVWTVAHELRQPLSAMTTAVAVMEHDSPSAATAHAIAVMGRQLRQMSRMVDDLLDAARLSSGKMSLIPELLDIRQVMADAAADIAAAAADTRPVRGRGVWRSAAVGQCRPATAVSGVLESAAKRDQVHRPWRPDHVHR